MHRVLEDGPDSLTGRGLLMLDVLSEGRWGWCSSDGSTRTVWFEIHASGPA